MIEPDVVVFLDETEAVEMLEQLAGQLRSGRESRIVLDFSNVKSLSSTSIAKLIKINEAARDAGGKMVLCSLSPQIQEVLDKTRLVKLFAVVADIGEAKKVFAEDPSAET